MANELAKNSLTISDLSRSQESSPENTLMGGYVNAQANTSALSRFSTADAWALATGSITRTNAQTSVNTMSVDNFDFTTADAMASAYARTGYHIERIDSHSLSVSFSNISEFNTTI